jgi:hypothetical protein
MLEPRPGEEIQITRQWKGRATDPITWTICLSPRSEQARAREEAHNEAESPSELTEALQASIDRAEAAKLITEPPTIVRKPPKRQVEPQPRLFDQGTGTDGPMPALAPVRPQRQVIPWNVAFREVSKWVAQELKSNNLQWSDEAQQAMVCTCLIAEVKAGRIITWERGDA